MAFIGATGLNSFDEEIQNTSNYISSIVFSARQTGVDNNQDTSNYVKRVEQDTSNYVGRVEQDTSNYVGRIDQNTSNYVGHEISLINDEIGETNYGNSLEIPYIGAPLTLPTGTGMHGAIQMLQWYVGNKENEGLNGLPVPYLPARGLHLTVSELSDRIGTAPILEEGDALLPNGLWGQIERIDGQLEALEAYDVESAVAQATSDVLGTAPTLLESVWTFFSGNAANTVWGAIEAVQTGAIIVGGITIEDKFTEVNDKADKSLSIWNKDTATFVNNAYSQNNIGIGIAMDTDLTNKLEVNGSVNISTGNTYKINDVDLNYSHLGELPLPTSTVRGGVRPDGATITIDTDGVISSVSPLPAYSTSENGKVLSVTSGALGWVEQTGGGGGGGSSDIDTLIVQQNGIPKLDYEELKTPYESVNVNPVISPEYVEQSPATEYTVLDADDTNLIAHYKFDGDFTDSSGNGHHLTEYITEATPTTSTYSIIGESVQFINNDDYLEFPTSINPYEIWNGNGITFSFWVRFTEHQDWSRLIDFQNSTTNTDSGFLIALKGNPYNVNRAIYIKIGSTTFGYSNWSNPLITSLGVWNHILFSIDTSNNWNLYLNNVRINGTEQGAIPNYTWVHRFINKSPYSVNGKFDGQMDDFRIYNKALTPTEIGYLANKMIKLEPQPIAGTTEYKTLTFTYDDTDEIVYDFTDKNTLETWEAYAETIPGYIGGVSSGFVSGGVGFNVGVWNNDPISPIGFISFPLPAGYDSVSVYFGNPYSSGTTEVLINNVLKESCSPGQFKTYTTDTSGSYVVGDYIKIQEQGGIIAGDMIITLSKTQTPYTLTFDNPTECDILIVAGGGGGGTSYSSGSSVPGAGGGAGGLIFLQNQTIPADTYTIKVGKGGDGDNYSDTSYQRGKNGFNSSFNYLQTEAIGGGGGASREGTVAGNSGGSGGGSVLNVEAAQTGGSGYVSDIVKYDGTVIVENYRQGYNGGETKASSVSGSEPWSSGGGGAGEAGKNNIESGISDDGDGGDGISGINTINFKNHFGLTDTNIGQHHTDDKVYFAGGGGTGYRNASTNSSTGGLGGGGDSTTGNGENGKSNTGGGGSGGRASESLGRWKGGNGGSGIVIIRYKTTTEQGTPGYLKYDTTTSSWITEDTITITKSQITDMPTQLSDFSGSITSSRISDLSSQSLSSFAGSITKSRISDFPTIPTNFDTQYYRKDQFVHNIPANPYQPLLNSNWFMRASVYTPNLFCVGGRPLNQYRYIVSASPNRDHDVSLHVIHFVVSYNEKGSAPEAKFRWSLLYSPNASHWNVVFIDKEYFAIDFTGPDKFDYMNVNIR